MNNRGHLVVGLIAVAVLSVASPAFAQVPPPPGGGDANVSLNLFPITAANVSAASGNATCSTENDTITITITDRDVSPHSITFPETCAGTTASFTYDASSLTDGILDATAVWTLSGDTIETEPIHVTKDTVGPTISDIEINDSPAANATFDTGNLHFTFNVGNDAGAVSCYLDTYSPESCVSLEYATSSVAEGTHTFTIVASDENLNEASTTVTFVIDTGSDETDDSFFIEQSLAVPNGCAVTDTNNIVHVYPATSSPSEYLAICAIVKAKELGYITDFTFVDFGFGLFLDSINGVATTPDWSISWGITQNDADALVGLADLPVASGDTLTLKYAEFPSGTVHSQLKLHILALDEDFINVVVPDSCEVTADASGNPSSTSTFTFPTGSSPSNFLGVCALVAARDGVHINDFSFIDFGFGLFLDSVNGVATDADFDPFWVLSVNATSSLVGITDVPVTIGDILTLSYAQSSESTLTYNIRVIGFATSSVEEDEETPTESGSGGGGGGGGGGGSPAIPQFNVPAAVAYLASLQNGSGSFATDVLTDWAALTFAAYDPGAAKTKLRDYLLTATPGLSSATDYERHAMALMALGINPYNGTATDYIAGITSRFDGTQIGDAALETDDIFALFPLTHAGYGTSDTIVQKAVAFIVSRQFANGSWANSVDTTAAAIQALSPLSSQPGVSTALSKAKTYLQAQQQSDASWSNSFATSWVMQAIAAFGETQSNWTKNNRTPQDSLALLQQSDGGVESTATPAQTRAWATEYAVPGVLGKTWHSLLGSFTAPSSAGGGNAATSTGEVLGVATSTATSTPTTATTTPQAAEDTPEQAPVALFIETPAETGPAVSAPTQAKRPAPKEDVPATTTVETATANQTAALGVITPDDSFNWWWLLYILVLLALGAEAWRRYRKERRARSV